MEVKRDIFKSNIDIIGLDTEHFITIITALLIYSDEKNESLAYFKKCVEDGVQMGDMPAEEIYELKDIIARLERETNCTSELLDTMLGRGKNGKI